MLKTICCSHAKGARLRGTAPICAGYRLVCCLLDDRGEGSRADELPTAGVPAAGHLQELSRCGWASVDSILQQAIADKNIPGAVLIVGHDGKVIYRKAYGERALEPKIEPMTLDTVFDLGVADEGNCDHHGGDATDGTGQSADE